MNYSKKCKYYINIRTHGGCYWHITHQQPNSRTIKSLISIDLAQGVKLKCQLFSTQQNSVLWNLFPQCTMTSQAIMTGLYVNVTVELVHAYEEALGQAQLYCTTLIRKK